ncbi:MAG: TilS substrate-binding domain-containing protein, partial [Trichodesmium sp. St15_bin1_1]|nr:TilS substrate-binding domain-containing protein [Trichodesmium sp. St15_bin1_1]
LKIWEDSTNQDLHYARNRIRLELFPILSQFNPQAELALAKTAEILSAEVEYFENETEKLLERVTKIDINNLNISQFESQPIRYIINRLVLLEVPLALQRRVMRHILHKVLPANPNFSHIEKLTALINAPNRSQTDPFPGGAIAKVQHPWIILV